MSNDYRNMSYSEMETAWKEHVRSEQARYEDWELDKIHRFWRSLGKKITKGARV